MKTFNVVQMENGFLVQVAKQPNQILKSLVFEGEEAFSRLVETIQKELEDPTELTIADNN